MIFLEWTIFALFAIFIVFVFYKSSIFKNSVFKPRTWVLLLLIKFGVGIGAHLLHTFYLGGTDAFNYIEDAQKVYDITDNGAELLQFFFDIRNEGIEDVYEQVNYWEKSKDKFLIVDNRLVIRYYLILGPITLFNFYTALLVLNFIFLFSFAYLTKALKLLFKSDLKLLALLLLITPSLLFWNSYLLKEAFVGVFINLLLFAVIKFIDNLSSYKYALLFLFIAFFAFQIKTYILILMMPGFFYLFIRHQPRARYEVYSWTVYILTISFFIWGFTEIVLSKSIFELIKDRQASFIELTQRTDAASAFYIQPITDVWSFLILIPQAFVNVAIQPQLFSFKKLLYVFPLLENFIFFIGVIKFRKLFTIPKGRRLVLALFLVSFLFGLTLLIGMTVPVQGAIVRYKTPLVFNAVLFIFTFINESKYKNSQGWLKQGLSYL